MPNSFHKERPIGIFHYSSCPLVGAVVVSGDRNICQPVLLVVLPLRLQLDGVLSFTFYPSLLAIRFADHQGKNTSA